MISFTINLEVMSRVGARRNGNFRGWHEMQRKAVTIVKTNGSKTNRSIEKLGNITSAS